MANKLKQGDTKISLEEAQAWVKKWKNQGADEAGRKKVDSFLIPVQNLAFVLAQGIDAARAYVGINNDGNQTLMIVGTKYDEKTGIYVDMIPGYGDTDELTGGEAGIYDFAEPSPPGTPDPNSPMNE
ncbi:hypothetical protein EYY60_00475 [Flavobacterium zhairuonense]|uniref:hypothetical protein n=1 Tax=Flavobacterium zhairuonense TaxID=2493631 RepID=UPI001051E04F|nr:hypothetical protein [Flavobacterium zhairuonense]KAF2517584.1 hypothetical protein EYY60_00475 [Flavobacterium zhairuonense]